MQGGNLFNVKKKGLLTSRITMLEKYISCWHTKYPLTHESRRNILAVEILRLVTLISLVSGKLAHEDVALFFQPHLTCQ